ncbi:amino acid ABC transporter permease [Aneurinibacillus migulanus]|uniref:Amino acid ABC transporter permease n=1 Tax=Aneurinibacillus migulanus TaxID=47500 RepID=A0A0D1XFQ3_ANEMI|nr:ABC transporter permease [Aneurinibacillus migulanus]KIV51098.1 amino acid ABC transporter permease [Aneurinibacillus migulanus]KIV57075.1 amino acid ABC transporter permease [Aneurinibacillus migulanus]KON93254.1 amino acid ABC transporter permease [Aneurinibacillus migulanus]KPD09439.1 amino acid ABC transporter permease [Aneurinibacillus migulanus]MCP1356788.1 ABC transporter permease [Aneurinibacillus migulanus]
MSGNIFSEILKYLQNNWSTLLLLIMEHIGMVVCGLLLALVVGIPLGILAARSEKTGSAILALANVIQVFPSLALLALLMVFFGIGFTSVVIGLFLYSLLPIIRNTYVGLKEVDKSITEAGRGVGMTAFQLLAKVQIPLSLSFILSGIRIAAVIAIGVATLAPFIGGEGLGKEIYSGINLRDPVKIYVSAILAALIAIFADFLLGKAQKRARID